MCFVTSILRIPLVSVVSPASGPQGTQAACPVHEPANGPEGDARRAAHVRARCGLLEGREWLSGAHSRQPKQVGAHASGRVVERHVIRFIIVFVLDC